MFDPDWDSIRAAVGRQPDGEFHLSNAYEGWDRLSIGDKVKTGNVFLRAVRNGDFPEVEDTGRKSEGGRIYRKRGG
jgi:hypothetical protein